MAEPEVKSTFAGELIHGSLKVRGLLRMRTPFQVLRKCVHVMAHRRTKERAAVDMVQEGPGAQGPRSVCRRLHV